MVCYSILYILFPGPSAGAVSRTVRAVSRVPSPAAAGEGRGQELEWGVLGGDEGADAAVAKCAKDAVPAARDSAEQEEVGLEL